MDLLKMYEERAKVVVVEKYELLNKLEDRGNKLLMKSKNDVRKYFKYYSEDNEVQFLTSTLKDLELEQKFLVDKLSHAKGQHTSYQERI